MQEQQTMGLPESTRSETGALLTAQSLSALLALAGSKTRGVDEFRRRMKLTREGFETLLAWLQRQYLVDVVSTLQGYKVEEAVVLTDKGEHVLLSLLEQMCELPELN
jgi:predicted transcriptional regulator